MYSYKKAFTLVELMIVIAVLGILMAALVPSISTYMARGRNVGRATDVKNINIALKNYYYDFSKTPHTHSGTEAAICMGMTDTEMCWKGYKFNPDVIAAK
jgi:prepilin-type N-terminal cleavage/methylation domain-containing protein